MIEVLIRVVMINVIILINHIFPVQWLLELMRYIILIIGRRRLKTCWVLR
jgi:hypothetical protein